MPEFIINTADAIRQSPPLFIVFSAVFGLLVGSFLNVVIHRLPRMMEDEWRLNCQVLDGKEPEPPARKYNLFTPRSNCPHCGHPISALENIPVLSYLAVSGKCRGCKARISPRYPLVEIITGALTALVGWQLGFSWLTFAAWVFVFALIALTFIDFDTQLLPDSITLPLVWLGLIVNYHHGFTDLPSAVAGAIAGYLSLWMIYWIFKLVTGKEGMGYGDFKLFAAIGAWFGWQLLPAVILLSSVVGSLIGIGLIVLTRQGRNVPMPFGPYLALGGIAALFFGADLSGLYLVGQP